MLFGYQLKDYLSRQIYVDNVIGLTAATDIIPVQS